MQNTSLHRHSQVLITAWRNVMRLISTRCFVDTQTFLTDGSCSCFDLWVRFVYWCLSVCLSDCTICRCTLWQINDSCKPVAISPKRTNYCILNDTPYRSADLYCVPVCKKILFPMCPPMDKQDMPCLSRGHTRISVMKVFFCRIKAQNR